MKRTAPEIPDTMARLPRDRRGLPVPHVAAWTSETWGIARAEPLLAGRVALFTHGRQGRGHPRFDIVNEERQRRAVLLGRCQVCNHPLPVTHCPTVGYTRPYGWLPHATLTAENRSYTADGTIVTSEPLCCHPCARWVAEHCCHLARHDDPQIVRVDEFERVVQLVDPSKAPPAKTTCSPEDTARLGKEARRHGGLVGFVKLALTRWTIDDTPPADPGAELLPALGTTAADAAADMERSLQRVNEVMSASSNDIDRLANQAGQIATEGP